jgi:hypothetical protein
MGRTADSGIPLAAAWLYYRDQSSTQPFFCSYNRVLSNGSIYSSTYKYPCGTPGGCDYYSGVFSWTGYGYIQWWAGYDLPPDSAYISVDEISTFYCHIPMNSPAGSFIMTYGVYW